MKILSISESVECGNGRVMRTVRLENKPFPMAVREFADSESEFPVRAVGEEASLEIRPYINKAGALAQAIELV